MDLWDAQDVYHNPVKLLNLVTQQRLQALADDEGFLAHYDRVMSWLDSYMAGDEEHRTWFRRSFPDSEDVCAAYFSFEFGINECIPIYSGGLGLLAGDHLKSASDLGVPLVAVGILYQQGYFRQYLNNDGWQQEEFPVNDFYSMPVQLVRNGDGAPLVVDVDYPGRTVHAQVWYVDVGRVRLHLLDTNIASNGPDDRNLTRQLYGGDTEMRIQQELLLGVGGVRALAALGIEPSVFHMNEGHSAFLAVERIRSAMVERSCSFEEAAEIIKSTTVFTTHTPVPAGNDEFSPGLIDKYFGPCCKALGVPPGQFLQLGQVDPTQPDSPFGMTVLALHLAAHSNGVSKLHGQVAREMWTRLWPG